MSNLVEEVYTGAAEYGKFNAMIGFVIGTIVGLVLVVVGIVLLTKHVEQTLTVKGVVLQDSANKCDSRYDQETKQNYYNCDLLVEYTLLDGQKMQKRFNVTNQASTISTGQMINLYYKASDPSSISANNQLNSHVIGAILLVVGVFLIGGSWFWWYTTRKYKFAAAGEGVASVVNLVKNR